MIICHAISGQSKIDHFKFRVGCTYWTWEWNWKESAQLPFHWQKCATSFWKSLHQKNLTNREKGQANKDVCSVLQTAQNEGDIVLMPWLSGCTLCCRLFLDIPHQAKFLSWDFIAYSKRLEFLKSVAQVLLKSSNC
jgi:hypothetical protein